MNFKIWGVAAAMLCTCISVAAQSAPAAKPEPEEPDFAFVSGSPYTQVKKSVQIIHQTAFGTRRVTDPLGTRNDDSFLFFQRVEYGMTDRWELDIMFPAAGSRTRQNGATISSAYGMTDAVIGARYRFLDEESAPVTVAMGPQLILPTGSVQMGTGLGGAGFAWDVAVAKDWGGPVFWFNTFNYHVIPSGDDSTPGSSRKFALHGTTWATAIGLRPMERARLDGSKHDLHGFLELGGNWQQSVDPGAISGTRVGELTWTFAPGLRYGYITSRKMLIEIGVSVPIGLGPNGPKRGVIIQFQFEKLFGEQ
ncbi:MAG: hypothetical protein M1453_09690 [Acidobacteria bacterium]|nr:hypothetical protein [Acidobacteriota bacterium]MCL5288249.1 hypothetical protein [Acidobacteriota bacterium]